MNEHYEYFWIGSLKRGCEGKKESALLKLYREEDRNMSIPNQGNQ